MTLARWQRTHADLVYLSEDWRREALEYPESSARRHVLETCASELDDLWDHGGRRRPFARLRMWLLAQRWTKQSSNYAFRGDFGPALLECAHVLEVRSL